MVHRQTAIEIQARLRALGNSKKAKVLSGFFKTGPGEYGEGDVFLGIQVPVLRKVAAEYQDLSLREVEKLLHSPIHEERLVALLILIHLFSKGTETLREEVYALYLKSTGFINNWDLVDLSAPQIVGAYLRDRGKGPLPRLAKSSSLWERRIAVLATFHFIKENSFEETLHISKMLLNDREDLIHKAVGWMLREVGKRRISTLESFLSEHYKRMPRTMLRYAIERFPESMRKKYLSGEI
jgi:3-methyladenine DNA glycosylase AlkD